MSDLEVLRALDRCSDPEGWATVDDIASDLGRKRVSVSTTLVHARNAGLVESRHSPRHSVQVWGLTEQGYTEQTVSDLVAERDRYREAGKELDGVIRRLSDENERLRAAIREHRRRTEVMTHSSQAAYIDADLWSCESKETP